MLDTVILMGADDVARAGRNIADAADRMSNAASQFEQTSATLASRLDDTAFRLIDALAQAEAARITLRDYYIAHAPHEPQPWFEPVVPDAPKAPAWEGAPHTEDERKGLAGWREGYLIASDIQADRARAFAEASDRHEAEMRAHYVVCKKQLYAQWPAAWADLMLAERAKGGQS